MNINRYIVNFTKETFCIRESNIMGKQDNDKVSYTYKLSQHLPRELSLLSSYIEDRSTTKWRPTIPLPKSPKLPKSLVKCGVRSMLQPKTALKLNIRKIRRKPPRKKQNTKKFMVKSNVKRKRKSPRKRRNDISPYLIISMLINSHK